MIYKLLTKSNRPYVKPPLAKNVLNHRHNATVDSMFYDYVISPLCDWIVETFLPKWLAPNVITLIGWMFNFTPLLVMVLLFGPETEGPLPTWFGIYLGISYFVYNLFDNCDGK
jgi:ethanolaminephosphotransferase